MSDFESWHEACWEGMVTLTWRVMGCTGKGSNQLSKVMSFSLWFVHFFNEGTSLASPIASEDVPTHPMGGIRGDWPHSFNPHPTAPLRPLPTPLKHKHAWGLRLSSCFLSDRVSGVGRYCGTHSIHAAAAVVAAAAAAAAVGVPVTLWALITRIMPAPLDNCLGHFSQGRSDWPRV